MIVLLLLLISPVLCFDSYYHSFDFSKFPLTRIVGNPLSIGLIKCKSLCDKQQQCDGFQISLQKCTLIYYVTSANPGQQISSGSFWQKGVKSQKTPPTNLLKGKGISSPPHDQVQMLNTDNCIQYCIGYACSAFTVQGSTCTVYIGDITIVDQPSSNLHVIDFTKGSVNGYHRVQNRLYSGSSYSTSKQSVGSCMQSCKWNKNCVAFQSANGICTFFSGVLGYVTQNNADLYLKLDYYSRSYRNYL